MNHDEKMTEALNKYGAFFAFTESQFREKELPDVEYINLGQGLICPKCNAKQLTLRIIEISDERIAYEKSQKADKELIWEQLANYECQITYDYTDAVDRLESYGITKEQVEAEWPAYMKMCRENNYF